MPSKRSPSSGFPTTDPAPMCPRRVFLLTPILRATSRTGFGVRLVPLGTCHPGTGTAGEPPVTVREPVETRAANNKILLRASRRVPARLAQANLQKTRRRGWGWVFAVPRTGSIFDTPSLKGLTLAVVSESEVLITGCLPGREKAGSGWMFRLFGSDDGMVASSVRRRSSSRDFSQCSGTPPQMTISGVIGILL
jgi:hypothetical protein